MAAFMGLFFSSAVELAGAGRQKKKKHNGLEEQLQTIFCSSQSTKLLKFKLWQLKNGLGSPKTALSIM